MSGDHNMNQKPLVKTEPDADIAHVDNCYIAWREFESYAEPVTEKGVKAMQRRKNQFEAGWKAAEKAMSEKCNLYVDIHDAVVKDNDACKPNYTALPQRTWVELTDEEVKDIVWNLPYEPSQEHIRAIEAKLKEKNT